MSDIDHALRRLKDARESLYGRSWDELWELALEECPDSPYAYLTGVLKANLDHASFVLGDVAEELKAIKRGDA